jgi:hypothetical protein
MSDYSDVKWKDNGKLKLMIIVGTRPGNHPSCSSHQQDAEIF